MGVLVVGRLEHLCCSFVAEDHARSKRLGRLSGLDEALGHFGFEAVDNEATADRATGRHRLFQSFQLHHRVARRCARIEDHIREVAQFLGRRAVY